MQTIAPWFGVVATLLATSPAPGAQVGEPTATTPFSTLPELSFNRTSLPNGMRVITSIDRSAPTLAACLVLPVGSRDEHPGALGMASLAQKVALEGARGDDVSDVVRARGGQESSTVGMDATDYCVVLPASELALAVRVLSARMTAPPPTVASFTRLAQRVQEQARRELADNPRRAGAARLQRLAFEGYGSYENAPAASALLIDRTAAARARDFYVEHQVPRGAAVVLVGDFDAQFAVRLAQARMGGTASSSVASRGTSDTVLALPRRTSERFSTLESPKVQTPELMFGWVAPTRDTRQRAAFELGAAVLGLGQGSRLEQRLVTKGPWASLVQARTLQLHGPDLLLITVLAKERADLGQISKLVEAEVSSLASAGPSVQELERARTELSAHLRRELSSNVERARLLGQYEAVWGTAASLTQRVAAYATITPTEVRDATRTYLQQWQQTLVQVQPKGKAIQLAAAPLKKYHIVRPNETLTGIAKRYGVTVSELAALNDIGKKGAIFPGQKLGVPRGASGTKPPRTHTVRKGDSLLAIAKRYQVNLRDIIQANGLRKNKPILPGQTLVIPPSQPASRSAR